VSASKFQAEEIGQMTFFENGSGMSQKITLQDIDPNYNRREQLNWERDLVGLYVSDHPLRETAQALKNVVTHYSADLASTEDQQFVRVFGEVVRISKIMTKKGKEMAFVRLEDVRGFNKLVFFPDTWKRYAGMLNYGKVIIAEGKVDLSRGDPSVLVDSIKTELHLDKEHVRRLEDAVLADNGTTTREPKERLGKVMIEDQTPEPAPEAVTPPVVERVAEIPVLEPEPEPVVISEPEEIIKESSLSPEQPEDDMPPEPEIPPEYEVWYRAESAVPSVGAEKKKVTPQPVMVESAAEYQPEDDLPLVEEQMPDEEDTPPATISPPEIPPVDVATIEPGSKTKDPPPITAPVVEEQVSRQGNPQMLTVVMRSLGDKERDILRMRRVYGMLISEPGPDRFAFYVIERSRGYRLEFPSDTTNLSDALRQKLEKLMGAENVIVELITIQ
jgi:DNA polymerase-3 subunit alpha